MDKKFLNRVVDQLVRETTIDYERELISSPFSRPSGAQFTFISPDLHPHFFSLIHPSFLHFIKHCEDVYGLNWEETRYVWKEYKQIIIDKINNG